MMNKDVDKRPTSFNLTTFYGWARYEGGFCEFGSGNTFSYNKKDLA
jgi:hypothetical protein